MNRKEIITGDGRIFKETSRGTLQEQGGKGVEVAISAIKDYDRYTGTKSMSLKDSARNHPNFTQMMWDKSKH